MKIQATPGVVGIGVPSLYLLFALAAPAQQPGPKITNASTPTYATFDVPGAGTGSGQGTFALSVNALGAITGYYYDASGVVHGFARAPGGNIASFDPPGSMDTIPRSINAAGTITGYYADAARTNHGFVRAAHGAITTFDVPGAGTGHGQGTRMP